MTNPASILEVLKKSPRGQLVYERQASISPIELQNVPKIQSPSILAENEGKTLAGSLADVSSVLEDVTTEMSDIQLKRVSVVIKRIKHIEEVNKEYQIDEEEENEDQESEENETTEIITEITKSPLITSPKICSPFKDEKQDLVIRVQKELEKAETERRLKVESKVNERKKRLSQNHEENRRKSQNQMDLLLRSIQAQIAHNVAKEKEAEESVKFQKASVDNTRAAMIQEQLQKAKQLEAAKIQRKKKVQADIQNIAQVLISLHPTLISVVDQTMIDSTFAPLNLSTDKLLPFLETVQSSTNDDHLKVLQFLQASFSILIENAQKQKEVEKQEELENQRKLEEEAAAKATVTPATPDKIPEPQKAFATPEKSPEKPIASLPNALPEISEANLLKYQKIIQFRDDYIQDLKNVNVPKEFKFTCQKALTTPLNAISDVTADHLKDKLIKLISIFDGKEVQATENTRFQATVPAEFNYAKNLLAKKIVSHGEEVVASKPKNAFVVAALITALWSKHPDFGQVFLAYLYETCPFLIPKSPQRSSNASDAEYFKSLGFYISDTGIIEDKTMFLKRVSGMTRMYSAVAISRLPGQESATRDHPHGLGHIWTLLASIMNLKPVNDITATVIYEILNVTGNALFAKYGAAFGKLLETLTRLYFPQIQQVTEEGCGGPLARLELFLQKAVSTKSIDNPQGMLRPDFL